MTKPPDQVTAVGVVEDTQDAICREIAAIHVAYERNGEPATGPLLDFSPYRSTLLRHPKNDLCSVDPEGIELSAPCFGEVDVGPLDADLTIQSHGDPIGERIIVEGRVVDGDGRAVRGQLVEIWQANAGGRYVHTGDQHPAALDPHFIGVGRCLTDRDGGYRFTTIKPGPYPWRNHRNAWRPAHIHFSFFGRDFTQRLTTQMYFPGDPLFALDPILQSIPDAESRARLVAAYDHELSSPEWATGYRWNIVLTGSHSTPVEDHG